MPSNPSTARIAVHPFGIVRPGLSTITWRLCSDLLGEVLQHPRLADARITADLDVAATVKGGVNGGDTLVSCQHHVADPIADVGKRVAGSLGESRARG